MFGSAKPAASLSSGLLARKGQARPAMRPQGFIGLDPGTSLDDLGWNDMGSEMPAPAPVFEPVPPVLAQRQTLVEEFAPEPQPASEPVAAPVAPEPEASARPVSTATAARIGREVASRKGKAAFTLRLDHERHLKLRLASAVTGRSAQALVTEALDVFLESLPELGALVDRLPAGKAR
ncbi:hypothetical protein [Sphingomonas sp.]|jgi:hypothetical protein|uniref:hypothetical protein n=1 Tax=Sphingomonas sp. TaxID=28214 RepID=UPI002E105E0B|nr:hypothetical protein [Sphingomonas sp.]